MRVGLQVPRADFNPDAAYAKSVDPLFVFFAVACEEPTSFKFAPTEKKAPWEWGAVQLELYLGKFGLWCWVGLPVFGAKKDWPLCLKHSVSIWAPCPLGAHGSRC